MGGPAIAESEGMRWIGLALVLLMTACGAAPQGAGGTGDAVLRLLALGVYGAGAAAHGAGERSREGDQAHIRFAQDAYICELDSSGGEEVHASSPEQAYRRCVHLNGERPGHPTHCHCELLNDHY